MRNQIEVAINVRFNDKSSADRFNDVMERIKKNTDSYKWTSVRQESELSHTFYVSTYEEYEAIATNTVLLGGTFSYEISFDRLVETVQDRITKKENAKLKAKKQTDTQPIAAA